MRWIEALSKCHREAQSFVLLTALDIKGSSPCGNGRKMLVTQDKIFDTIGGGALEYESIDIARTLLKKNQAMQQSKTFNLGRDLKQCCGGVVTVFFEVFNYHQLPVALYGAGHVGRAIIKILEDIECQVKWFDSRSELFPDTSANHIEMIVMDKPEVAVELSEAGTYHLIMTHDHGLDQTLCEAILSRGDSQYCGLIGSSTKGLKFRQRLLKKGFSEQELAHLSCPMGLSGLRSKQPMEIAVSVVSEIMQLKQQSRVMHSVSDIVNLQRH